MLRRLFWQTFKTFETPITNRALSVSSQVLIKDLQLQSSGNTSATIQTQTESYLNLLKNANDAKEVLECMPTLDKRKIDRQAVTLNALKTLFELHKLGKSSMQRQDVLNHPRFAELCKVLKYEARGFLMNDITESLKILTYFGVRSNSEIMTVFLQLLRHQINDVTLEHIVFLNFILKKMDRSPLVEALQLALPMLLQIQITYKMDHENVQQLVDLIGFVSQHRVSDRCVMNVVSALTLHGTSLTGHQAADVLKALVEFNALEPFHVKLLNNMFETLIEKIDEVNFKTIDFIMKKIVEKNLDKFPMFFNDAYFKRCAQFVVDHDMGIMNALYFQKKLNKVAYLHIPLLDYIGSQADSLSIVPNSGIITIVAAFSNADYRPRNWETIKSEISRHSFITNPAIPWIRYNLELLSLDIFNKQLIEQYLDPVTLERSMHRNILVDYLQLLELSRTLQLLFPEYDGPLPDKRYIEKGTAVLLQNNELPLQKPLEMIFGGEGSILSQVTSDYGHVLDHVLVFDREGRIMKQPILSDDEDHQAARIEDVIVRGNRVVVVMCLPKSYYALNINRLRGRFAMYIRTIEALGVAVVPVPYQMWSNLPEAERLPFLEREVRAKVNIVE
ncbi:FAST kinase domain-containing protein 2, mitochondrial [Aedes aegypti]|uniref:Uncharacterized protein n=1 Tax=Aedes aegypti TaxID=7159 RepID=A0A6I8T3M8_AEDAE|nr:FAST kinase domain-containing protein 2, mitochondrial [Aedes aegypti]